MKLKVSFFTSVVAILSLITGGNKITNAKTSVNLTNVYEQKISETTSNHNSITSKLISQIPNTSEEPRFICDFINGQYTVMYRPRSQPNQSYPWAVPSQLGGGWTPERRCFEISQRLESYRPDGLEYLQLDVKNGYDIICAVTELNPDCRIILTIPPGQDPQLTFERVFDNLILADSGDQTQGITTFSELNRNRRLFDNIESIFNPSQNRNNSNSNSSSSPDVINLSPFLDQADGGTGVKLQNNSSNPNSNPNPNLNPDNIPQNDTNPLEQKRERIPFDLRPLNPDNFR